MFMQEAMPGKLEEEFSRPVESIMRCEDFKSNFARRLSNRYTSRSPVAAPRQDTTLKLRPDVKSDSTYNVPERIEPYSQLSKSVVEQNGEGVKPPDKLALSADIRCTEVTALNMEVETLRWQLAQTEANRQMHIALLKQIVTFLNRVRDHIDSQKNESPKKETMSARAIPRSFNVADLPRSKSVLHVNKNLEYLSPTKKISTRKISKSISNVNGFKDNSGVWTQSKLSLISEKESTNKMSEEMSRLITLANTVLSTKLPDLACTCNGNIVDGNNKLAENNVKEEKNTNNLNASLTLIEEDSSNAFILNTIYDGKDAYDSITNKFIEIKDSAMSDFIVSQSPLTCGLENDFAGVQLTEKEQGPLSVNVTEFTNGKTLKSSSDKRNEYSHVSNFIEDESGFSSMSSFQEIGIPIISIIPPSPCKEVGYMEEMPDILEPEKWKTDTMELDKQTMKVFWV